MTATTTSAPLLNGQLIGITYHAIAAVRDRLLAASDLTFHQSVALKAVSDGLDRTGAVDRMTTTLKIGESEARTLLDELADAGLLDDARTSLTDKGDRLQQGFTDAVAELAERLYGGLPAAEREIAARALAHVTARANAELAAQ
jgi:DNA-binding MarR family transcriptional regulator